MWLLLTSTALVCLGASAVLAVKAPFRAHEIPVAFMTVALGGCTLVSLGAGALFNAYRPLPLTLGTAVFAILCWALALGACRARRMCLRSNLRLAGTAAVHSLRRFWRHPVTLLLLLLTAAVYMLRAWISVRLPVTDWDGLMYHLAGPDKWIQAGAIVHTPESLWADTYPMGVELLAAWPAVFLRSTQYMPGAQLACYLLGAFSVLSLARCLGARRPHAVLVACAFLLTPAVFAQAHTMFVDVSAAAFVLAALSMVAGLGHASVAARPQLQVVLRLAVTGLAAGLAVGAKSSNLAVIPVIALAAVFQLARLPDRGAPPKAGVLWAAAAALALPAVMAGSWWYLRTWAAYKNPFYPVSLLGFPGRGSVQDVVIRDNVPPELRDLGVPAQLWVSWTQGLHAHPLPYDIRLGGLGPAWLLLILPGALIGLLLWKNSQARRGPAVMLAVTATTVVLVSPAAWWGRYVLVTIGALLPLAAYALTRLSRARAGGYLPRLLAGGVTASTAGLLALSAWWGHSALPIAQQHAKPASPASKDFTPLRQAIELAQRPDAARQVWPWWSYHPLDSIPDGSTIALLAHHAQPFTHPLVGTHLQRRIATLSPPATAHELAQAMHTKNARYVLIETDGQDKPLAWDVLKNPQRFRLTNPTNERIYGADLFELGHYPTACTAAGGSLPSSTSRLPDGRVQVTGRLLDGCGKPVPGEQIDIYATDPTGNPANPTGLTNATTDHTGSYTATTRLPAGGTRYTYSRTNGKGPLLPPTVSNLNAPTTSKTKP